MDYQAWLNSVRMILSNRRPDVRVDQIDPNQLHAAYTSGVTPISFVLAGQFRFKPIQVVNQPQQFHTRGAHWLPITLLVVAIPVICGGGCFYLAAQSATETQRRVALLPTSSYMFDQIKYGTPATDVLAKFGEPGHTQQMNSGGITRRIWYYQCRDGQVQVVMEYGSYVTSINKY